MMTLPLPSASQFLDFLTTQLETSNQLVLAFHHHFVVELELVSFSADSLM